LLQPGTYDYLNTCWSYKKGKPNSFPNQNAISVITNHSLSMLDEAARSNKPFFMAVAPAIPHVGIAANGTGSFMPVPVKKWANAFREMTVPKSPSFNPNKVSLRPFDI
jgi:N-acetylglucosamine-6-sulfatase